MGYKAEEGSIQDAIATRIWEATRGANTQEAFEGIAKEALDNVMANWGYDGTCFYQP